MTFEHLTSRIIGAAFRIHNALGPGYLEHVYRNALALELEKEGFGVRIEVPIQVQYQGTVVSNCFADLIVERLVVVETKAKDALLPGHLSQLRAYLRSSGIEAGLALNFGPAKVDVKRADWSRKAG